MSKMIDVESLYILAAGHSGSTLLNLILGAHSRAVAVSELTNLPVDIATGKICTCGAAIGRCDFWRLVAAQFARKRGLDFLEHPHELKLGYIDSPHRGPYRGNATYRLAWKLRRVALYGSLVSGLPLPSSLRARFDEGMGNRLALYEALRGASGAQIVVDASKEYLQGATLARLQPRSARLILLVRDGRAVFYSNFKRGFGRRVSLESWRNYWRNTLGLMDRTDPTLIHRMRYEDLATHPEKAIRNVCEFAGIEFEPAMLDLTSKPQHVTSGNDMRFNKEGIKLDEKWRVSLAPAELEYFERHAGELNRRLGYG